MTTARARYEALRPVFAPRGLALIGANDRGLFLGSGAVLQALDRLGYDGGLSLVNRRGNSVFGLPATRTLAETGRHPEMAAIVVPAAAVPAVLPDLVRSGVRAMTVLAGGFGESGPEGAVLERGVVETANAAGLRIVGPNCLGFVNFVDRVGVWFSGLPAPIRPGAVGIVSQSGGVGDALMEAAHNLGIGLSTLITTGNEPSITSAEAIEYLVEDPSTRAVVAFAEGIRRPDVFVRAALRARELRKGIVMVKAGTSALGARNALSHTGSLVGDDAVTDSVLQQLGVIRVHSLDAALTTAQLVADLGPIDAGPSGSPGVGVVSLSGGSATIFADSAARHGLAVPELDDRTVGLLRAVAPPHSTLQNPYDITGAADEHTFERVLEVLGDQPDIGLLAVMCNVPTHRSGATGDVVERLESIARGMDRVSVPAVLIAQTGAHLHPFGVAAVRDSGIRTALPGIEAGTEAIARLLRWSQAIGDSWPGPDLPRAANVDGPAVGLSEVASRQALASAGVQFVAAHLALSEADAVEAWRRVGAPVAVKIVSAQIAHKSDMGGVVLGADSPEAVSTAYRAVLAAAADHAPAARVDGVLIARLRPPGVELVAGITLDQQWGWTLVVGMGGVLIEAVRDTAMRVLPVGPADIDAMLDELSAGRLLHGHRGVPPVDRAALIAAIAAMTRLPAIVGPSLVSAEVNPLVARADGAEGLDALVVIAARADDGAV